ncbi:ankyrin repeat domain-containing protein [Candidatus Babeliales bacterium]|nr:ankyrin repeat domain-containing protein [Candidatus Babeliales bacterium]
MIKKILLLLLALCESNNVYGASGLPSRGGRSLGSSGLQRVRRGAVSVSCAFLNEQMFNTIEHGWLDIVQGVERLLAAGADVNAVKARTQETALHLAVQKGWVALVSLLLAKGANVHFSDAQGRTPMAWAQRLFFDEGREEIICLLVRYGASKD